MELDELKDIWKQQKAAAGANYSRSELLMLINNRMISFEERIRSRDRLEVLACIAVIIFFGAYFFVTESLLQQVGSVVLVSGALLVWYRLKTTDVHKTEDRPMVDLPMAVHLERELRRVREQKKLLGSIAWWYILPLTVGLLIFALGFQSGWAFKAGYITLVLAMGGWVWKRNRDTVRRKFAPLEKELEEAMEFIRDGEES
ncbi:MAG: hypothetical protein U5K31_00160 [Balneolaceae bacterium]|nr:hypothetical protein [Balneolaceae bacterium]